MTKKVLFVCRHNLNRSRVAEVITRDIIKKRKLNAIIDSAGINVKGTEGRTDYRIKDILSKRGYEPILDNTRKAVTRSGLDDIDLVLAMSPDQKTTLEEDYGLNGIRLFTLPEYATNGVELQGSVPDPTRRIINVTNPTENTDRYIGVAKRASHLPLWASSLYLHLIVGNKVDNRDKAKIREMYHEVVDSIEKYANLAVDRMEQDGFFN